MFLTTAFTTAVTSVVWWARPDVVERGFKWLLPSVALTDAMEGLGTLAEVMTHPDSINEENYKSRLYASRQGRIYVIGTIVHLELYALRHLQKKERLDEVLSDHAKTLAASLGKLEKTVAFLPDRVRKALASDERGFTKLNAELQKDYRTRFFEGIANYSNGPMPWCNYQCYRDVLQGLRPGIKFPEDGYKLICSMARHMRNIEVAADLEKSVGGPLPFRKLIVTEAELKNFARKSASFNGVRFQKLLLYLGEYLYKTHPMQNIGRLAVRMKAATSGLKKSWNLLDQPDKEHQKWVKSLHPGSRISDLTFGKRQGANQFALKDGRGIAFSSLNEIEIVMRYSGDARTGTFAHLAQDVAESFHSKGYYVTFAQRSHLYQEGLPSNFMSEVKKMVDLKKLPAPVNALHTVLKRAGDKMVFEPHDSAKEVNLVQPKVFKAFEQWIWQRSGRKLDQFKAIMNQTGLYKLGCGFTGTTDDTLLNRLNAELLAPTDHSENLKFQARLRQAVADAKRAHSCVFLCPDQLIETVKQSFKLQK